MKLLFYLSSSKVSTRFVFGKDIKECIYVARKIILVFCDALCIVPQNLSDKVDLIIKYEIRLSILLPKMKPYHFL